MKNKRENEIQRYDDVDKYFGYNIKMLWLMGLNINLKNDKEENSHRILDKLPIYTTIFLGVADGIFQVMWVMDAFDNEKHLVTQISSNLLSNITAICKGVRLIMIVDNVQSAMKEITIIWKKNLRNNKYRNLSKTTVNRNLRQCMCYILVGVAFVLTGSIPPTIDILFQYFKRESRNHTYDFSTRIFLVRYPFEINTMPKYLSIMFEEYWVSFGSALSWICSDLLFCQLTTQVCLQLQILQRDIISSFNDQVDDEALRKKIVSFVRRHRELLRICYTIEKMFSPIALTTTLISALNICMNVYELKSALTNLRYLDAFVPFCLVLATFSQIVVYCTFAESLTEETSQVANTIYTCDWTDRHHKLRFYILILIMKSQPGFHFTACGLFRMCHLQLANIFRTAMSYYMYLQTMD